MDVDHPITRHRHEPRRRHLTVRRKSHLTPGMIRVVFEGEALADFTSLGADDHVKLFIPTPGGEPERRDYTPRRFDRDARTLLIDFAVHDAGPATRWALDVIPGDVLEVGGPRGSAVVAPVFDWWLLVGDETALPAIGRRVEELPAGVAVTTLAAVAGPEEEQRFETAARHRALWVHRPVARADDPAALLAALEGFVRPEGDGFVWIAAEAGVARTLRDHLSGVWGHPPRWTKAAGYWRHGVADAHEKLDA